MKEPLCGICFKTVPEILQAVDHSIRTINTTGPAKIPKMKEPLCGICFKTVPEILQAVDRSIRTINTTGILRLPHRWKRVVHNAGDYTEGQ
jgi:bacterioferritin-associated ferredoxin